MKPGKTLWVLAAGAALMLASCGPTDTTSTTSTTGTSDSTTSSSTSSSTSETPVTYQIRVQQVTGATITVNPTTATPGTVVTVTVTLDSGYTLTNILVDGKPIEFTDNQGTFIMPDYDVTVSCQVNVEGEMTLNGSVTALFEKEGDLYVARNVTVNDDADLYVLIKGEDETYTPLAYNSLNRYKTFADIGFSSISFKDANMPEGTVLTDENRNNSLFELAGNAAYDFYYDPSDAENPLYVQRVKVLELPKSYSDYESLFAGTIKSDPATYPMGVIGVTYTDSRVQERYVWNLVNENASLATVYNSNTNQKKAYVYNEIKDGVLYTVDNYLEGRTTPNLYPDGYDDPILDDSRAGDTTAYSSKKAIVSSVADGYKDYQITEKEAKKQVASYSHDVYSIDRAQWSSYRDSFNIEDDLVDAARNVSSVKNDDNTFTVTVDSYKIYNPSRTGMSAYNRMEEDVYIEYDIEFTFTEAGAPLDGVYQEMFYDSTLYDFDTHQLKPGAEGNGTLVKALTWKYTYGDVPTGTVNFDSTPYFATSIAASVPAGSGNDANHVTAGSWNTQSTSQPLTVTTLPATALDAWQYGVVESSDNNIIGPSKHNPTVYEAKPSGSGDVTLTIGNHVDDDVTTTITLHVSPVEIHSFFLQPLGGYGDDWHLINATAFQMNGGSTWTATIDSSPYNGSLEDMTFTYSTEGVISASVNPTERTITFKASKVTTLTSVSITLNSPYYEEGWSSTVLYATIIPYDGVEVTEEFVTGTWAVEMSEDSMDPDLNDPTRLIFNEDHTGSLKAYSEDTDGTVLLDVTYSFNWILDVNTSTLSITDVEVSSGTVYKEFSHYSVSVAIESTGKIGIAMYGSSIEEQDGELIEVVEIIMGGYDYDEDGYMYASAYSFFVPAE